MKIMPESNTPILLWWFCCEYTAGILSFFATGQFQLQGRTPYETVMNCTPNIFNKPRFHGFSGRGYMMRSSKARIYADGYNQLISLVKSFALTS